MKGASAWYVWLNSYLIVSFLSSGLKYINVTEQLIKK